MSSPAKNKTLKLTIRHCFLGGSPLASQLLSVQRIDVWRCIHCGCRSGENRKSEFFVKSSRISKHARFQQRSIAAAPVREQGFSVIEAMVGFLILGITITALCGGFSFGFNTIKLSQEEVRADQILVQKLESLRIYSWSKVTNTAYIPANFTNYYTTSNANYGVTYLGQMTVGPFSTAGGESYSSTLRQVTATVSWFSEGMTHTRTMSTLVSSSGLATYTP